MHSPAPLAFVLAAALSVPSHAATVTVPVDVGVGPAAYWFFGPLTGNRGAVPHFGLKVNVLAVIDAEALKANRDRIPAQYRRAAEGLSEVRVSPSLFIPDSLILSPKAEGLGGTGVYGVTWRPISLGFPLSSPKRAGFREKSRGSLDLQAGLVITYAFIYSDFAGVPTTHFIRPGIDLKLEAELMASDSFGLSFGWASQFYVPQKLGELGIGEQPLEGSIFHVGQAFLKLHFRAPYETAG